MKIAIIAFLARYYHRVQPDAVNTIKKIIPSYNIKYKIKSFLDKINYSKNNSNLNLKDIPDKYIVWNNDIAKKTGSITKINLDDWII